MRGIEIGFTIIGTTIGTGLHPEERSAVLYPIYGILNLFVLGLLIIYPINRGFNK